MLRFAVDVWREGRGPALRASPLLQLLLPHAEGERDGLASGEPARPPPLSLGAEEVRRGGRVEAFVGSVRGQEAGVAVKGLKMRRRRSSGGTEGAQGPGGAGQGKAGPGCGHDRVTLADVRQAFDLEALGHFQQRRKVFLVNADLSAVHELQQSLHLVVANIFEKDNRVLVRSVVEHRLKVRRAGGKNHLVRLQVQPIAGNRDIHESFMIEKILEDGEEIVLVVVPAETVLLGLTGCGDSHGEARG